MPNTPFSKVQVSKGLVLLPKMEKRAGGEALHAGGINDQ